MLPVFFTRLKGPRKLYNLLFLPLLEQHHLTQLEADILLFLANNPEYDTARDIVEIRHLAKSHVSVAIDSLVERGLLQRFLLDGNRKTIHLRLTDAAAPVIEQGRAVQAQYADLIFAGFSDRERQDLFQFLERVSENIDSAIAEKEERRA